MSIDKIDMILRAVKEEKTPLTNENQTPEKAAGDF
jgi:hypothetical protein